MSGYARLNEPRLTTRGIRGRQITETDEHEKSWAYAQGKARRQEIEAGSEVVLNQARRGIAAP